MKNYLTRAQKIQSRISELALCSDDPNAITRVFGSSSFFDCSKKIAGWMKEAGLKTCIDNIGNVRGKLLSKNPRAKTFVIGSHFDTVINAGKYDGVLGIVMGLDIVEHINEAKSELPFHLEIIAFSEEEGARFHSAYLGSKLVAGNLDPRLLEIRDEEGISLRKVLEEMQSDPGKFDDDKIPSDQWLGYFEIHIEQGPVLYERGIPVGVVNAIDGQKKIEINFTGEAGHAGTVPMNMRADALCAAAHFIVEVEEYALHERRNVIATVGKISVPDGASNVIAGRVNCTLDLRSPDAQSLSHAYESVNKICEDICRKRRIYFDWKLILETDPVICDENLKSLISKSVRKKDFDLIHINSGAGHDAGIISQVAPVAMLFVKCYKGISHNPLENVETVDIAAAAEVIDHFIKKLGAGLKEKIFTDQE